MRTFNHTEKLASKQQHPRKAATGWEVVHCGKVVYQSNFAGLCQYYIDTNNLKGAFKRQK